MLSNMLPGQYCLCPERHDHFQCIEDWIREIPNVLGFTREYNEFWKDEYYEVVADFQQDVLVFIYDPRADFCIRAVSISYYAEPVFRSSSCLLERSRISEQIPTHIIMHFLTIDSLIEQTEHNVLFVQGIRQMVADNAIIQQMTDIEEQISTNEISVRDFVRSSYTLVG